VEKKRVLSLLLGVCQEAVGLLFAVLAVLLALNLLDAQTLFKLPSELLPLILMILVLFCLFSFVNGVFLIREWRRAI